MIQKSQKDVCYHRIIFFYSSLLALPEIPADAAEQGRNMLGGLVKRTIQRHKKGTQSFMEGIPYPPLNVPSYFQKWADPTGPASAGATGIPPLPTTPSEFFVSYARQKVARHEVFGDHEDADANPPLAPSAVGAIGMKPTSSVKSKGRK